MKPTFCRGKPKEVKLPLLELASVVVRLDDAASVIADANPSVMRTAVKFCVTDCIADCVWLAIPQGTDGSTSEIKSKLLSLRGRTS